MTSYGYRLFTFQVFRGSKRTPLDLADCKGEPYQEIAESLLKILSVGTAVGDPTDDGQAEVEAEGTFGKPALRVEEVRTVENTIRATVWAGKFGSHEKAIGDAAGSDTDIKDKAASNLFRVIFTFPEEGDIGILAVESIGRSCPVAPLIRWMTKKSRDEATQGNNEGVWWRISASPLADEDRLAEMIREGQAQTLVLVRHAITASRTRTVKDVEITASLAVSGRLEKTVQVVQGWYRRNKQAEGIEEAGVTNEQGARQLAAIVGPQIADMDLDDGWVQIEDPDGQVKRVKPTQMTDVFTYRLSEDHPPVTPRFYAAVRETALGIQPAAKVGIDWPVS
ncbi:hypothetical protein [Streptomyces cinerochromogenes]|uniref:hypothetical protein n=1 Tax=Streptomyces cinerochromogenes TaxID=66422 RepID=UPI001670E1D1|nr:hypothetical protein [Streptomyces cinerochromogenes]GGS52016.1 hypothetical protein GCM10010206_12220 [Streptomyces cinerochromogenes]